MKFSKARMNMADHKATSWGTGAPSTKQGSLGGKLISPVSSI